MLSRQEETAVDRNYVRLGDRLESEKDRKEERSGE
jgi:hypothetical protein